MVHNLLERGECFTHSARGPGKIHYQRSATNAGDATRKRRPRKLLEARSTNVFGNSLSLAIDHRACRLGSDIPRRETSSTSRQNQVDVTAVARVHECRSD